MRNPLPLLLLIFCTCVLAQPLTAQKTGRITNSMVTFDKTSMEAMRMEIDASPELVTDRWEEFWDDRYDVDIDKTDRDKMSTAFLAEQASIPLVSPKAFGLYSKVEGNAEKSTVSLAVAFSDKDVATRDVHRESYVAAEAIMQEFRTYFYTSYFDEQLEEARKELDDIRDDSSDASEDAEKAQKKIRKYEDKMAKYQKKIDELRDDVGDELESAEEKAARAEEMARRVRDLEQRRARYL